MPYVKKVLKTQRDFRNAADELFMIQFRGKACEVCKVKYDRMNYDRTCGHHIIPKSKSKLLRYEKRNIIVLCPNHHRFSSEISAHSFSSFAVANFNNFLYSVRQHDCDWLKERQNWLCNETFRASYTRLQAELQNGGV